MGVTGARAQSSQAAPELVAGSGPRDPDARSASGSGSPTAPRPARSTEFADAVIVGSALVKTLLEAEDAGDARRPDRAARGGRRPGRRRPGNFGSRASGLVQGYVQAVIRRTDDSLGAAGLLLA